MAERVGAFLIDPIGRTTGPSRLKGVIMPLDLKYNEALLHLASSIRGLVREERVEAHTRLLAVSEAMDVILSATTSAELKRMEDIVLGVTLGILE